MSAWNGRYNQVEVLRPDGRLLTRLCPECSDKHIGWPCETCDGDGEVPVYVDRPQHEAPHD
jgi:hypothetical protein